MKTEKQFEVGQLVNFSLRVPIPTFGWHPKYHYQYTSVSGVVTEMVEVDGTHFLILNDKEAVNLDYILE